MKRDDGTGAFRGKRIVTFFVVCMALVTVALAEPARGHQPHDEIRGLGLSPNFANDGTMVTLVQAGLLSIPLISYNGGVSFERIVRGIDHRGKFTGVAFSPHFEFDQTILLSSSIDGVYRSTDGGHTFVKLSGGLPSVGLADVVSASAAPGTVITLAAEANGLLYFSETQGTRWRRALNTTTGAAITAIEFFDDFEASSSVLVGDADGQLYLSEDGGRSFTAGFKMPTNVGGITDLETMSSAGDLRRFFVSTDTGGIFSADDIPENFTSSNVGITDLRVNDMVLSPDFMQDHTLFAVSDDEAVYRSNDGGLFWELHEDGLRHAEQKSKTGHYWRLQISADFANDRTLFVGAFDGLFRSVDSGLSYRELETRPTATISRLVISPDFPIDGRMLMSRYGGGMYRSEDAGSSWDVASSGIQNPYIYDVVMSPRFEVDSIAFAAQANMILRTDDGGLNWEIREISESQKVYPKNLVLSDTFHLDQTLFVGSRKTGLFRSQDGGRSFESVLYVEGLNIDSVLLTPDFNTSQTVFVTTVNHGVLRSTDGGSTFEFAKRGLPSAATTELTISPSFESDQLILAATPFGLYQSTDLGNRWSIFSKRPEIRYGYVESVWFAPADDNFEDQTIIIQLRGHGLRRSDDRGETWRTVGQDLHEFGKELNSLCYAADFAESQTIMAASDLDLWRSDDGGESWTKSDRGVVRFENYNQQIYYDGKWETKDVEGTSASSVKYSGKRGDELRFYFTGSSVSLIGAVAPILGRAEIYLNGEYQGTIDQYDPQVKLLQVLFQAEDLAGDQQHILGLVIAQERHPDSKGFGIVIDAFDVQIPE